MNQLPSLNLVDKEISKIGIGTWGIGGYMNKSHYSDYVNEITQIKYQINKGLSLIDCWVAQSEGSSIELIRQSIDEFARDKVVLMCKFDINKYRNIEELEEIFNKYLSQLKVSYIDIFQLHKPDFSIISEKQIESFLLRKISEGKVKGFAVSNSNIDDLKNIQSKISVKLEANEILYNIFDRSYENDGTVEYCNDNNIVIIAYRPLNRGMTNTLTTNSRFTEIVKGINLTPNQVALNWLLSKKNVMALVKSSNRAHISENLDCMHEELSEDVIEALNKWKQ